MLRTIVSDVIGDSIGFELKQSRFKLHYQKKQVLGEKYFKTVQPLNSWKRHNFVKSSLNQLNCNSLYKKLFPRLTNAY